MKRNPELLEQKRISKLARPVFKKYGIEKAILFGSFATGRQGRKSDVDLILFRKDTELCIQTAARICRKVGDLF